MNEFYKLAEMVFSRMPHGWRAEVDTACFGGDGCQIIIYNPAGKRVDDAVYHCFSHGFEEGLLESYKAGHCNGYETAKEIFSKWKKMFRW